MPLSVQLDHVLDGPDEEQEQHHDDRVYRDDDDAQVVPRECGDGSVGTAIGLVAREYDELVGTFDRRVQVVRLQRLILSKEHLHVPRPLIVNEACLFHDLNRCDLFFYAVYKDCARRGNFLSVGLLDCFYVALLDCLEDIYKLVALAYHVLTVLWPD